jgi:hypothetical protein
MSSSSLESLVPVSPLTREEVSTEFDRPPGDPFAWGLVREADGLSYLASARWLARRQDDPLSASDQSQSLLVARHFARQGKTVAFLGEEDRDAFHKARGHVFPKAVEPWFVPE